MHTEAKGTASNVMLWEAVQILQARQPRSSHSPIDTSHSPITYESERPRHSRLDPCKVTQGIVAHTRTPAAHFLNAAWDKPFSASGWETRGFEQRTAPMQRSATRTAGTSSDSIRLTGQGYPTALCDIAPKSPEQTLVPVYQQI